MIIIGIGLLFLKSLQLTDLPPEILTLGRLHPIILHFPIVLILLLFVGEIFNIFSKTKIAKPVFNYIFITAVIFTLASILSGFLLYSSGEFEGMLMDQHFLGALATGFGLFLTYAVYISLESAKNLRPIYLILLLITNISAFYTSHQGGSLTHGKNYLSEYLPFMTKEFKSQPAVPDTILYIYEDVIQPILETKCAGCHHSLRAKGGFSVASLKDLFAKGESGKLPIIHYLPDSSELIKRILLPDTISDHMPPVGKIQVAKSEIAIIKYWIMKGAKEKLSIAEMDSLNVQSLVYQLAPNIKKYRFNLSKAKFTASQIENELKLLADELEVSIKKDNKAEGDKYTISNKFPPVAFDSKKLLLLKPYMELFTKVSLVSSQLDDADLYFIGQMTNLKELYLQKTKLKGQNLMYLSRLPNLEILNISFTETDDKAILDLTKFPALKEVYLYGTKTSNDVIKAIMAYKPSLKIHSEEGPYL